MTSNWSSRKEIGEPNDIKKKVEDVIEEKPSTSDSRGIEVPELKNICGFHPNAVAITDIIPEETIRNSTV